MSQQINISDLSINGDGVGFYEGIKIHAPFTLPGDIITGSISGARIAEPVVLEASPHRIPPLCSHFKTCGGCTLQHGSDLFLSAWKKQFVERILHTKNITTSMRSVIMSGAKTRRRAVLSASRGRKSARIGFHQKSSKTLVEISECHLICPEIMSGLPGLKALAQIGASRTSEIRFHVTSASAGLDIAVSNAKEISAPLKQEIGAIAAQNDFARLCWNGQLAAQITPPLQYFEKIAVLPPSESFLQATQAGEDALRASVREIVHGADQLADLFAGCGTFALPLTRSAQVYAAESDADMLKAMQQAWDNHPRLKPLTTERRDLFRRPLEASELQKFDAVVLDPPRVGALAQVAALAQSQITRIAYVSCNPASFARDAQILVESGFQLEWVQIVDQFRWSPHIELVGKFQRG